MSVLLIKNDDADECGVAIDASHEASCQKSLWLYTSSILMDENR